MAQGLFEFIEVNEKCYRSYNVHKNLRNLDQTGSQMGYKHSF